MAVEFAKDMKLVPVDTLIPYEKNARTHSDEQINQIANSIKEFGFTNPILVDSSQGIIAGHGRLAAAKRLKLDKVPVIILDHLTPAQKRAYVIADNKLALNSGWDTQLLSEEIEALRLEDFDVSVLGFSEEELGELDVEVEEVPPGEADEVPELAAEAKVVPGEIFILGNHRLMCGDSTSIDAVEKLMNGERADMVFTDPPYGIALKRGDFQREAKGKFHGETIRGDDSVQVAIDAYNLSAGLGVPTLIFWGANYYASSLPDRMAWIVWDKQTVGDIYADCELAWTNEIGRVRKFTHQWHGMIKGSERGEARVHPTQKPVVLAEWSFENYGNPKTVLDLFGGSGSTLIACEKTNRKCFMMELDPKYCGVILDRWQKYTGKKAHREDGTPWDDIRA